MTEHQSQALGELLEALEELICASSEADHHPNVRIVLKVACFLLQVVPAIVDVTSQK